LLTGKICACFSQSLDNQAIQSCFSGTQTLKQAFPLLLHSIATNIEPHA